jgi:hypothetical protein
MSMIDRRCRELGTKLVLAVDELVADGELPGDGAMAVGVELVDTKGSSPSPPKEHRSRIVTVACALVAAFATRGQRPQDASPCGPAGPQNAAQP